MDYYILLALLPCLVLACVFLFRFIQRIRRPRYIKDDTFMMMSNGGNLLDTAARKSITVLYRYIDEQNFFCVCEE